MNVNCELYVTVCEASCTETSIPNPDNHAITILTSNCPTDWSQWLNDGRTQNQVVNHRRRFANYHLATQRNNCLHWTDYYLPHHCRPVFRSARSAHSCYAPPNQHHWHHFPCYQYRNDGCCCFDYGCSCNNNNNTCFETRPLKSLGHWNWTRKKINSSISATLQLLDQQSKLKTNTPVYSSVGCNWTWPLDGCRWGSNWTQRSVETLRIWVDYDLMFCECPRSFLGNATCPSIWTPCVNNNTNTPRTQSSTTHKNWSTPTTCF